MKAFNNEKAFQYASLPTVEEEGDGGDSRDVPAKGLPRQFRQNWALWSFLIASICCNVYFLFDVASLWNPVHPTYGRYGELYSPAAEIVEHEVVKFHSSFDNDKTKYQGGPSDEVDQAWWDLYRNGHTRITKDQARQMPNATAAIPGDEDHYIVELNVFHQLHCLDTIRKALSPDYYTHKPSFSNHLDDLFGADHIDHCIDFIRQSIQCSSDVSPIVWQWSDKRQLTIAKGQVVHSCRNFEKLQKWADERQLEVHFDNTIHVEDDIVVVPF